MNLDDIVGNSHLKKVLKSLVFDKPILFEGELGCGKSSLASIVARDLFGAEEEAIKDINCVHLAGVAEMREEIDNLHRTSVFGAKKCLILDELHGLSDKAQEVLLAPLQSKPERPLPKDVLVIACTTTTERVKKTLLSRFIRLRVLPLNAEDSLTLVNRQCKQQGITIPKPILALLIEKSKGIPRLLILGIDTLKNITDIAEAELLLDVVELENSKGILDVLKCLLSKTSWDSMIPVINKVLNSTSPSSVRVGLINLISGRLLSKFNKEIYLPKIVRILHEAEGYPEKALLISALYEIHLLTN